MVRHLVIWTLKEEAEGATAVENAAIMKEKLEALNGRIEGLQRIDVSYDIIATDLECQVVLCSEHDDVDALNFYQNHPEHKAAGGFVGKVASSRKALDYVF